jgi:hypothetical protein
MTPLEEAQDPTTSPARLIVLSQDRDERVRRAVAGNPNTPLGTMDVLCKQFPWEVANNPALALALLDDPNTLSTWKKADHLFTDITPPDWLIDSVLSLSKDLRPIVAWNANTPSEVLERFGVDNYWLVRMALANNVNTPSSVIEKLVSDPDSDVRSAAIDALKARS